VPRPVDSPPPARRWFEPLAGGSSKAPGEPILRSLATGVTHPERRLMCKPVGGRAGAEIPLEQQAGRGEGAISQTAIREVSPACATCWSGLTPTPGAGSRNRCRTSGWRERLPMGSPDGCGPEATGNGVAGRRLARIRPGLRRSLLGRQAGDGSWIPKSDSTVGTSVGSLLQNRSQT